MLSAGQHHLQVCFPIVGEGISLPGHLSCPGLWETHAHTSYPSSRNQSSSHVPGSTGLRLRQPQSPIQGQTLTPTSLLLRPATADGAKPLPRAQPCSPRYTPFHNSLGRHSLPAQASPTAQSSLSSPFPGGQMKENGKGLRKVGPESSVWSLDEWCVAAVLPLVPLTKQQNGRTR